VQLDVKTGAAMYISGILMCDPEGKCPQHAVKPPSRVRRILQATERSLLTPKGLLHHFVPRGVADFKERSAGPSGLSRSPATIDQQPGNSEQEFHAILLS
jgi:hypothetical protein